MWAIALETAGPETGGRARDLAGMGVFRAPGALEGMRIGVTRESLVYPPGSLTEVPAVQDPVVRDLARRIELQLLEEAVQDAPGVWPAEVLIECAGQRSSARRGPHAHRLPSAAWSR